MNEKFRTWKKTVCLVLSLFISGILVSSALAQEKRDKKKPSTRQTPTPQTQTKVPYEGALPPNSPNLDKNYPSEIRAGMETLYRRPMPKGPAAIPLKSPIGINVVGRGQAIRVLPGKAVFSDKLPPMLRTALPENLSPYSNNVERLPKGEFRLTAFDRTQNDSKQSQDSFAMTAEFTDEEGNEWKIMNLITAPFSPKIDEEPWYGGVATDLLYHGASGKGTPAEPLVKAALIAWGWGDVWKNGEKAASSALIHVMVTSKTRNEADGYKYYGYDSTKNPVSEIHLLIPSGVEGAKGGFLHVVWENADIERGTPQKIAARAAQIDPSMPTIRLSAVPFLTWSKPEITVEVGQKVRLILDNEDPISFHAFMIDTPEGHVHVMMPQGGMWATTLTFDQPGEYRFWCPVSNHAKRGMYGRIIVGGGVPGGSFGVPGKNKQ
jgi:uncharacterized cupredoxin-like copper-binding protein